MHSSNLIRVTGVGDVDAGIAPLVCRLNRNGYKTHSSCSGLWSDHQRVSVPFTIREGYITFDLGKDENVKRKRIIRAAESAGLIVSQLLPLVVRIPLHPDLLCNIERWCEAAAISAAAPGRSPKPANVRKRFYRALRHFVLNARALFHDEWKKELWGKFERFVFQGAAS